MDREKAEKLLAALIFDDLDETSKAEALAYLQQDDELRERLADMRMAFKVTSDAVQNGPAPILNQQRRKRLARLAKQGQGRSRIVVLRRVGAVAALLIVGVSAVYLGILPRIKSAGLLSLPSKDEYAGGTSLRAEIRERYDDFAEPAQSVIPEATGIVPATESLRKRRADDKLGLDSIGFRIQDGLANDKSFLEENSALGRRTHEISVGLQPAARPETALPSTQSGSEYVDSPAPVTLSAKGQDAAPVTRDIESHAVLSYPDTWAMQPFVDRRVEALGQELDMDAYVTEAEVPVVTTEPLSRAGLARGVQEEARQRQNTELMLGYGSAKSETEDSPISAQTPRPLSNRQKRSSGSAGAFYWSDSGAQPDKQQVPALGDTPVTNQRGKELVTRIYDVSDLIRQDQAWGEAEIAHNESVQPSKPGIDNGSASYGWQGGGAGGMGGMRGGMGGMMGGMGGGKPNGEPAARGREQAGDALARSKALSEKRGAVVTRYEMATIPQSGEDHYGRKLSELSEKGDVTGPVSQPVDGLSSISEGRAPTLGKALAPSAPLPEIEQVLDRGGEVAADTEALSGLVAESEPEPAEPALGTYRSYGVSAKGRTEEAAARNSLAADGRVREEAAQETQVSQFWRRDGAEANGDRTLGLTREGLAEESKAGRRPATLFSIVAGTENAPSAESAPDPTGSRQVFLDTKVVVLDKDELMNLGVEWSWPTVQAGMFRTDDQVQYADGGQKQGQVPGDAQIGVSSGEVFTNALNMQLNLLEEQGEARVVANPKVVAQEGQSAELRAISDEYYKMTLPADGDADEFYSRADLEAIESGTKLNITAHISDDNEIILDIGSVLDAQARGTDLPLALATKNSVAVSDGGTVVLTGLAKNRSSARDEGKKEVAVLITPRLVPQGVAKPAEPQVEAQIKASEAEDEASAPMDADPTTHAKAEEDGFDLPPASRFKSVPVNPWVLTERDRLSTFALDVDTASYSLCRRYINSGFLPPAGAVRMEEFVNAFDYNYPQRDKPTFSVYAQGAKSPFAAPGQDLALLKIGVKARTVGRDQQRPAHLVLVVDASASMGQADRLPLVQHGLKLMVRKLSPADRVTLVTCAQQARLHLDGVSAQETAGICQAVDAIQASGTTNLLAGLKLGYARAKRLFAPGQVNHVLLCSDGVANVGQTEAEAVLQAVEADRKQGITITSVGVGFGTYNDVLLEALANRGDGSYVFLDSRQQAERVFVDQLTATLQGVAKDARIQVDFNAQRVRRYRLIGYENRDIEDKRFRDDTVDAGEVGSGQCSTALYEVELAGDPAEPLGTVFVRYRDVHTDQIQEIARPLSNNIIRKYTVEQEPRFFLAAGVARFAEWLRQSEHVQEADLGQVSRIIEKISRALPLDRDVRALAELIRQAEHLPRAP